MLIAAVLGLSSQAMRTCVILLSLACILTLGRRRRIKRHPIVTPPPPGNTAPGVAYSLTFTGTSGTVSPSITLNLTVH
jgi:hypothetical protein